MRASAACSAGPHPVFTSTQRRWSLVLAGSAACCPPPCQRPRLELACEFFFQFCDEASHSFTPGSDCRTLVLFFQTCCAPFVEKARSSSACWTLRSHDELVPPKTLEKKEGVPRWNQCWRLWARQIGASSAWFYSLAWSVFAGTLPILRGSDRDPARQTETCECEPCVRPPFVKRSGSFDQTSCLWSSRSLSLSSSFFFFFFFIFTFFRNGQGQNPPSPKRACPYFGKCGNLRTVP